MKLAIMQPYVFPYVGYFQLINCVDKFVIFDDVTFIKKGWINRNRILGSTFTIPLAQISQNKLIKDTFIHENYIDWRKKFYQTLLHTYKKAPYFKQAFGLVSNVFDSCRPGDSVSKLARASIENVTHYLTLNKEIIPSSSLYENQHLKAQSRIIDICKKVGATQYFNLSGGKSLYSQDIFKANNLGLFFVSSNSFSYPQFNEEFVPWLSIIDILMFNEVDTIVQVLYDCKIEGEPHG